MFRRELEQLAAERQAKVWFVAGTRDELGGNPLAAAELARRVPGLIHHDVYLCRAAGADRRRHPRAARRRRAPRQIHHESFEF